MDTLLNTDVNFLVGVWIENAKALASPSEVPLFSYNARNQITLWGWEGEINSYASKHWAGLMADYYGTARWVRDIFWFFSFSPSNLFVMFR